MIIFSPIVMPLGEGVGYIWLRTRLLKKYGFNYAEVLNALREEMIYNKKNLSII